MADNLLNLVPSQDKVKVMMVLESLETLADYAAQKGLVIAFDDDTGLVKLLLSNGQFLTWSPSLESDGQK